MSLVLPSQFPSLSSQFFFFALVNTSNSTAFSMPLVNQVSLAEAFPNSTKLCTKLHEIKSCQSSLSSTFQVSRVKLVKVLRELLYPDHTKTWSLSRHSAPFWQPTARGTFTIFHKTSTGHQGGA
uniref:(northern house mosquito) hypothetical protein n=1 Tax=Culex pipiens TaxID=7175 RepID=A0A8D8DY67_CULPI